MEKKLKKYLVLNLNINIKSAMKILEKRGTKILCFLKKNKLYGVLTDGDIRRSLLKGFSFHDKVIKIINRKPLTLSSNVSKEQIKKFILREKVQVVPITKNNKIFKIISYDDVIEPFIPNTDVVILAGGYGKRLHPITKKIPKTLVNVNNKKIIDIILENFLKMGFQNFTFLTHHFHSKIKNHLNQKYKKKNIKIYKETKPLGTCGGLSIINRNNTSKNLILINTDIITGLNFQNLLHYHETSDADLTIVSVKQNIPLKYGSLKFEKVKFEILKLDEKPNIQIDVNAGIYVLKKKCIDIIPKNKKFDIPQLFKLLKKKGMKIKIYPSHEYWYDIGNKEDLKNCKIFLKQNVNN